MATSEAINVIQEPNVHRERIIASTPSSSASCCLSGDDSYSEDKIIPASLVENELKLALNKDADIEELESAVTQCHELVLETDQCSVERKWLVRHLIELRLRLQESRDAQMDPTHPKNKDSGINTRIILGHHLHLQPFLSVSALSGTRKVICDQCASTIWSMLQAWYQCADCGYSCHHKCIPHIVRVCAHLVATEKGSYINEICPEKGLSTQKYQCAECKTSLTFSIPKGLTCFGRTLLSGGSSWAEARLCDYDGYYYCTSCHWNSQAVIPARVIHNWDMEKRFVSQSSAQLLKVTCARPLINLEKLNPKLFSFIHELSLVKKLREDLVIMKRYLVVCRRAQEIHLLWKLGDRHHLIDTINMYSLQDLNDIHSGELPSFLQTITELFVNHIKQDCQICVGRGHLCEICGNDEIIFPFEAATITCTKCSAVFHRICWTKKKQCCPRCIRIEKRNSQIIDEDADGSEVAD